MKNVRRRNAFVNMNDLLQSETNGMVCGRHGRTQIDYGRVCGYRSVREVNPDTHANTTSVDYEYSFEFFPIKQ
jgi:hypothetical protein